MAAGCARDDEQDKDAILEGDNDAGGSGSEADDDSSDDDDDDDDSFTESWTFVVYMAADNDLQPYALLDLEEMQTIGSTPNVNILAIYDGLDSNDSRYYYIDKNGPMEKSNPGELNMGDPQVLSAAVKWAFDTYPADRYALVLWSHGSGWHKQTGAPAYKYICQDLTSGDDWLDNQELDQALQWLRTHTDVDRIDLLGFDACLMQMLEIAYYVADDARVMVGSEETEGATGWAYSYLLSDLTLNPGMSPAQLGTLIAQTFVETPDATQSAVDLDKVGAVAMATDQLADALVDIGGIGNNRVEAALYDTMYFSDYDYIDLYDFALKIMDEDLSGPLNDAAGLVLGAVENAVIWHGYGFEEYADSYGLSIYFPDPVHSTFDTDYLLLDFAIDTDWDEAIQ